MAFDSITMQHYITVEKLRQLLDDYRLEPSWILRPNKLGNFSIYEVNSEGGLWDKSVGIIELGVHEEVNLEDESEEKL